MEESKTGLSRRDAFKAAGLGAGAAAVVAATGGTAEAGQNVDGQGGLGYRETEHVRKAYELARF